MHLKTLVKVKVEEKTYNLGSYKRGMTQNQSATINLEPEVGVNFFFLHNKASVALIFLLPWLQSITLYLFDVYQ